MTTPAKPRVGLIVYGLDRPLSGVTRVALELSRALEQDGRCDVYYLTTSQRSPFQARGSHTWRLAGCSRLPGLMALGGPMVALAAKRLRLDLVHDPVGVSPFTLGRWSGRFKRVTTIHDAIAFRFPEGYPWLNNLLHRHYVPRTLVNLDAVIAVSQAARRDLTRFLLLRQVPVQVVPNGVSERFRPADAMQVERVVSHYGTGAHFVLSVGASQERKNLDRSLQAFALIRREFPSYRLALAGPTLWRGVDLCRRVVELGIDDSVSLLGYVPEADLPSLYSAASLFVFPSLYEGFGLPVLEAMACGTPVVCSNRTSLPEIAGDAARLVDPLDIDDIAGGMRRLLHDSELRDELRTRGLRRAAEFTWARAAAMTVAVYHQTMGVD